MAITRLATIHEQGAERVRERKDDRRSTPTTAEAGQLVASLITTTSRVLREYEWAYRAAYERTVAEEVKVRGNGNDPTGSLVASRDKARARSACTDATELMRDALSNLRHAENVLLRALDRNDPREGFAALRYPRSATREDLRLAKEAQERRQARGEAVP